MKSYWLRRFLVLCAGSTMALGWADGSARAGALILDMNSVQHVPGEVTKDQKKVPIGSAELAEGKVGKAVRFSFAADLGPGFMTAGVPGSAEWDKAEGFSFYVKGDGSTNWGGLELIDRNNFALRYGFCFPIDSTEWRKVAVTWKDLAPELAGPLVDAGHGYAPSGFGNLWFGKWFYWRDYPAHSYAIDEIRLEEKVDANGSAITKCPPGLGRVRAKLKAGQAVTIVTMGDSLSDKRHWANREKLWSEELARQLKEKYGSAITLVNPAIGGTTLSQNLVLMPRWSMSAPKPDLVTVWFGFNDWDTGVRGERFKEYLRLAVDRIREQTGGSADVVLLTTSPAFGRWETMQELEQAVREVAKEKGTGLADIAAEFHQVGSAEEGMKRGYWAWDKVHLGGKGHEVAAECVMDALGRDK